MDNKSIAAEWFQYASNDFRTAQYLRGMRPVPIEIICYHCQQCAEKYLKGFIAYKGGEIQKTHDLSVLNKSCQSYDASFGKIIDACIELTDYGVQSRYPFNMDIIEGDMLIALKSAEEIKDFIISLNIF